MKHPVIRTPLPGPKAKKLIEVDNHYVSPSYTRIYPLVVNKAQGVWVEDVDGNVFLDFTAGIAVCSTGHCHPRVVQAIKDQADRLLHMSGTDFYYVPQIELAERLACLVPGKGGKKVYFGNSGAEAVEAAFKLARWHTRGELNIAFFGAFHGRTMGALSLTASKTVQRKHYYPFVPGITHIPYPYCYRCPYNVKYPECHIECVRWVEETLFRTTMPPEEVAAIFVEPIQGEGGYIVPPPEFHGKLYEIAERYNILYVADEVQSGMGRTGKMFAFEHFDIVPDIITMSKALGGVGFPISAIAYKEKYNTWPAGKTIGTFRGNMVAFAAGNTALNWMSDNKIPERALELGKKAMEQLKKLEAESNIVGEVRGIGLMIAIEMVKDSKTKEPASDFAKMVRKYGHQRGVMIEVGGHHGNVARLLPPLVITEEYLMKGIEILSGVIKDIEAGKLK